MVAVIGGSSVEFSPYVALLELYFNAEGGDGWADFERACAGARGSWEAEWVDPSATIVLKTATEAVGFDSSQQTH